MKNACAAVLCFAIAAGAGTTTRAGGGETAPQSPPQTSKVPPMSEDKRVKAEDIDKVMAKGDVILLDVREPKEIEELGGYDGAINIPIGELEKRLAELPKDKTILTA